ncbi:unnamed protein product [Microthlaspi erraticum]|uniref:Uncharacterized protein n=1 Tax=Microthlaspi erraticum TaxID=1685480 RepID=A0A6D2HJE6_9BRAS|nr:unnamed protein product [Microthlaspi erraticum]
MDFHGVNWKDLQALCKKHGIPANLKTTKMATRLASVFQETEEIVVETTMSHEVSVEDDDLKDSLVVNRVAKKVTFNDENQVFEFTRSLKKLQRKDVKSRKQGPAQDGIELRRSNRIVAKGLTVAGSSGNESNWIAAGTDKVSSSLDVTEAHKVEDTEVERRSTRLTLKAETLLPAKRFKRLVDIDVQSSTQEDDHRRSTRLKAKGGGNKSDGRPKESKEERKSNKLSKGSAAAVNSHGSEVVKRKTKKAPKKKTKKLDQECIENKPQGIIEDSANAAESVLVIENVLDSTTLEKSVDSSQRRTTLELNSEIMEGECDKKLEGGDTVLMAMTEEGKEQVSSLVIERLSPASVQLAVNSPEAELVVPAGRYMTFNHASSPKVDLKDDCVVLESQDAALDFNENVIADSSGSSIIASNVCNSHDEFIAGEETAGAEFTPKGSQATSVVSLSEFDIVGAETIMDAVNLEGDSETIGEISSHLEVAGTCSLVLG